MHEFDDLERLIDRELRQLPAPRAPRTLLPQVMAAARVQRQPVPRPVAAASDAWRVAAALIAGVIVVLSAGALSVEAWTAGGRLGSLLQAAATTAVLTRVVWEMLLEPLVTYAVVFVLVLSFAVSACWAAFRSLALEGASDS
jgi:hypothetical protein